MGRTHNPLEKIKPKNILLLYKVNVRTLRKDLDSISPEFLSYIMSSWVFYIYCLTAKRLT